MNKKVSDILSDLTNHADGIWSYQFSNVIQSEEIQMRGEVALGKFSYLDEISKHHSVIVMDVEIALFLEKVPVGGVILDVGGCWGWHWRTIWRNRPDVTVFILDFVRQNLIHATQLLRDVINKNVYLVHGDATHLGFRDCTFDAWWSVQTLQHIPNFKLAVSEAHRVLKPNGVFANYSLNNQILVRCIYSLFSKPYVVKGKIPGSFYLNRASDDQLQYIESVFEAKLHRRFSEILFSPELGIVFPGRRTSMFGIIDSMLSGGKRTFAWIARQQSFHLRKHRLNGS